MVVSSVSDDFIFEISNSIRYESHIRSDFHERTLLQNRFVWSRAARKVIICVFAQKRDRKKNRLCPLENYTFIYNCELIMTVNILLMIVC